MSGEFEDFKPNTKGADSTEGAAESEKEQFDPFSEERSLKGVADSKVEAKAAPETFKEGGDGEAYSDHLARTLTPQQNFDALVKALENASKLNALLEKNGYPKEDVTAGGNFLAGVVKDGSPDDISNFLSYVKGYIEGDKKDA